MKQECTTSSTDTATAPVIPTWNRQPGPESTSRFDELEVEGFTLCDGAGSVRHFEFDCDLNVTAAEALGSGTQQAVLLVALGLDGEDTHRLQLNYMRSAFENSAHVLDEAIEALEAFRDQLEVMRAVGAARATERNAFEVGAESQRMGLLDGAHQ